jgi:hypothetical protein
MLRPGGRVFHFTPSNNWTNHGFYQVSPTLYSDFYRANDFQDVRVYIAEQRSFEDISAPLDVYEMSDPQPEMMISRWRLFSIAVATKTSESTGDRVPLQGYYSRTFHAGRDDSSSSEGPPGWLRSILPVRLKTLARTWLPGLHPHHRPWRCRYWGRLT